MTCAAHDQPSRLSKAEQIRLAALQLAVDNASADGRLRVPADEILADAYRFAKFIVGP